MMNDVIVEKKEDLLNVRNEIIDAIDDVNDYMGVAYSPIQESILKRLENALSIMNEFLDALAINENYVPDG